MSSGTDKDLEVNDTDKENTDSENTKSDSMSKDEAKKFYEEKGLNLSPDVPINPKPVPDFEKSLAEKISSKFGDKIHVDYVRPDRIRVTTKREEIVEVAKFVRDELKYDHAESVSGVDYPDSSEIEVIYHLGSYTDEKLGRQIFALATRVPREEVPTPGSDRTRMPSLRDVFYSVEFHERECFEMFGVYFEGHPDMRRLLLPEDWADIPPFRKDFKIKGR
jgi:NADH-quinone oxidoreductase subunit C